MNFGQPSQTPEFLILSTEVDGRMGGRFAAAFWIQCLFDFCLLFGMGKETAVPSIKSN